jgi:hypothetical protein
MLIRHHINRMIGSRAKAITLVDGVGFSHPILRDGAYNHRDRAFAGLITTTALVVSLAIAMIAVSIGISRADSGSARTELSRVQ